MSLAEQLNIPEWTVYLQALVTLVIPIIISFIFKQIRGLKDSESNE
ncbi:MULTISPECIES: hypothetical protein [Bacillales]|nr:MULTISPECIES: hypothetical protein [Bacillales]